MVDIDTELYRETAEAAASVWADMLRDGDVTHDNGDGRQSAFANLLREENVDDDYDPMKVERFQDALATRIYDDLVETTRRNSDSDFPPRVTVHVDYAPDGRIQQAAERADLEYNERLTFPSKTTVFVEPGEVRLSEGYQADPEVVYSAE